MKKPFYIITLLIIFTLTTTVTILAVSPNASLEKLIEQAKPVLIMNQDPIPVSIIDANTSPTPSPITWEYATDCFSNWDTYSSGLPTRLNTKTGAGWELVSTLQFQPSLACDTGNVLFNLPFFMDKKILMGYQPA